MKNKHKPLKRFIRQYTGSKLRQSEQILEAFPHPKNYKTYVEPFIGSGAVLLALQPEKAIIGDVNFLVYDLWKQYRFNSDAINRYAENFYKEDLRKCPNLDNKSMKALIQDRLQWFNTACDSRYHCSIAMLGFLIYYVSFSFGGVLQNTKNGKLTLTYSYTKRRLSSKFNLDYLFLTVNYFLNSDIKVIYGDYKKTLYESLSVMKYGRCLIFLDPPYKQRKGTFTRYGSNNANDFNQKELFNDFKKYDALGDFVFLTHHDTKETRELYNGYKIVVLEKYKSKMQKKGSFQEQEILISNF